LIAWDSPARASWHDVASSELRGKHVGLYFGARWCQPCHRFMAKLKGAGVYTKEKLAVAYVSLDRDDDQFKVRAAAVRVGASLALRVS
jgi:thioredoxin-like negative regulator of GroEL